MSFLTVQQELKAIKTKYNVTEENINWEIVSIDEKLSESFIEAHKDKVDWYWISIHQTLSESFIEAHKDKIDWYWISIHQTLSESFIEAHKDKIDWYWISKYQTLSESFIEAHKDYVDWSWISKYQKLSKSFIERHGLEIPNSCWVYKSLEEKLRILQEDGTYEIEDGRYIIAYKSVKEDYRSVYAPNFYQYKIGEEYRSNCDCNEDEENSFGLSAWTKWGALDYHSEGRLLKVKIDIKDLGVMIPGSKKLRCFKFTVIGEEKP